MSKDSGIDGLATCTQVGDFATPWATMQSVRDFRGEMNPTMERYICDSAHLEDCHDSGSVKNQTSERFSMTGCMFRYWVIPIWCLFGIVYLCKEFSTCRLRTTVCVNN